MFIANIVVIIGSVVQAAAFKTRDMIVGRHVAPTHLSFKC